ncbi:MAG: hypothetical protein KGD61_10180 [Candidatus Lokiarchaeota archaeon]|nr:hypothetical protein [Candidatus Lokiarchaeota archaeon]
MNKKNNYTINELMVVTASRKIKDGQNIVVGLGLPQMATMLAKRTHAPNLNIIYEIGVVNPEAVDTGVGIADPRLWYRADYFTSFVGSLGNILQRGLVDVGFLGGLQVDKHGNLNSTLIKHSSGFRHFTGSGGAADIASFAKNIFIIIKHEKRKVVDAVDFITSVGYLKGVNSRKDEGLPMCKSIKIITNLCVFNLDCIKSSLELETMHRGIKMEDIQNNTGFDIFVPKDDIKNTKEPDEKELYFLRNYIDPKRIFL